MKGWTIRVASVAETPHVLALCNLLDPQDYVQTAWPQWLCRTDALNLVVEAEGQVIACGHGELVTPHDAWMQAIRVHPAAQRRGVGSQLLWALLAEFHKSGVRVARGSTAASNRPMQVLLEKIGGRIVASVCRRLARGRTGRALKMPRATMAEALGLVRMAPVLASRPHLARFKRAYFTMTDEHLAELVQQGAVVVSTDRQAYAILDPNADVSSGAMWVSAIIGSPPGMCEVLEGLLVEAGCTGLGIVVDSPAEPVLQSVLDAMDFESPDRDGEFVMVEFCL